MLQRAEWWIVHDVSEEFNASNLRFYQHASSWITRIKVLDREEDGSTLLRTAPSKKLESLCDVTQPPAKIWLAHKISQVKG